eukprot:TRINITY_DN5444_c0_g1_i1.p1 TRINITY_DN5444_c0_g1~~TRINITY_DN5444_c0_g1_i1.p1  ORF type:complete len:206 (+),score=-5.59 TRINITY_DN5444_c0_g1_i1:550-1167(+)
MLFNFRLNQKNYPDYKCSLLQGNQLFNKLLQLLFGKPSHKILQQVFQNIQACLKLKIVDFCSNFYSSPPLQISVYNYVRIFLTKIFQKKKCTNEVLLGNIIHRYFYNQNVPFFTSQSKLKIQVLNYINLIFFLYSSQKFKLHTFFKQNCSNYCWEYQNMEIQKFVASLTIQKYLNVLDYSNFCFVHWSSVIITFDNHSNFTLLLL